MHKRHQRFRGIDPQLFFRFVIIHGCQQEGLRIGIGQDLAQIEARAVIGFGSLRRLASRLFRCGSFNSFVNFFC